MTPIIDTHVHLWDTSLLHYGWIENVPLFNKTYDGAAFKRASSDCDITAAVFVQCDAHDALAEVAWVSKQAQLNKRIRGIVAFAPVDNGVAVRTHLDTLKKNPLVKGIRRNLQTAHPSLFSQNAFIAGVQTLADFQFSFDLCIHSHHLPAAITLVKSCPHVTFILDHLAKPNIKMRELDPWRHSISELAAQPNVVCKLSGLVTEGDSDNWSLADLLPYVQHVLHAFGTERIIWGSDWPVVLKTTDYRRWVDVTRSLLAHLDEPSRRRLLHDNALAVYRLS